MKIYFIVNAALLDQKEFIVLVQQLLKNLFPVVIIAPNHKKNILQKNLKIKKIPPQLTLLTSEAIKNIAEGYALLHAKFSETPSYGVVLEGSNQGIKLAAALHFYCIQFTTAARRSAFADIAVKNLAELFHKLHMGEAYQLQYLPLFKHLHEHLALKMGYPCSLLHLEHGRFTTNGIKIRPHGDKIVSNPFSNSTDEEFFCLDLGDPFVTSCSWSGNASVFEQDIIQIMGRYYGLSQAMARGFITTGGTEGNLAALWWARNNLMQKAGKRAVIPNLLCSKATHYSISKAASQLMLPLQKIETDATGKICIEDFSKVVKNHMQKSPRIPLIINANAGTTETGAIDDVKTMHALLEAEVRANGGHYVMHLDAAALGAIIPLVKPFGNVKNYFEELGISTIAISGHKFFGTTAICGIILTTHEFLQASTVNRNPFISYVGGIQDITPSGSRSGNSVLELHNILYMLDLHTNQFKLKKLLAQCKKNAKYLYTQLLKIFDADQIIWLEHSLNIIFPKPSPALIWKYSLMPIGEDKVGVCALINLTKDVVDRFKQDYLRELEP